jgi:hypothetical protein
VEEGGAEVKLRATQLEAIELHRASERKWGRVSPASAMSWHAKTRMLATADDVGGLRMFDISDVLADLQGVFVVLFSVFVQFLFAFPSPSIC